MCRQSHGLESINLFGCHDYLKGTCVGEARNPGPFRKSNVLQVAVANVRSLSTRSKEVAALTSGDAIRGIALLSETRAHEAVVRTEGRALESLGAKLFHGRPCASRSGKERDRGVPVSAGVAVVSGVRARSYRNVIDSGLWNTARLAAAVITTGSMDILAVSIYLDHHDEAFESNNLVLLGAFHLVKDWGGAALVGGDINHDVSIFPSWTLFQSEGWSTSKQIAQDIFGKILPPTFKNSTHQDLLLVPPELISSITEIRVEQDSPFPDHNPVYVSFDLQVQAGRKYVWKMPRPFTEDQRKYLRSKDLGQVWLGLVAGNQQEDGHDFQMWCQHVEQTFVQALPAKGPLKPGIKQLGRGRCPVRKCVQPKQGVRQARRGDFNPDSEVFAVRVKQVVKQVRRLQSLCRLFEARGNATESFRLQWAAVVEAKGFGTHFVTWAANHGVGFMPAHPNLDTLRALLEHVRIHAEHSVAQERKGRVLRFEASLDASAREEGNQLAFRVIRDKYQQEPGAISVREEVQCIRVRLRAKGKQCFVLSNGKVGPGCGLFVNGVRAPTLAGYSDVFVLPASVEASSQLVWTVQKWVFDPEGVHDAFFNYWSNFWGVEDEQVDDRLEDIIKRLPQDWKQPKNHRISVEEIQDSLKQTKRKTASGMDAWTLADLKLLPDAAWSAWIRIWEAMCIQGFPSPFTLAKIFLLPKVDEVETIGELRPICILSLLWRVTTRIIARRALQQFSEVLPAACQGALPKRGARDVWFQVQYAVEQALDQGQQLLGGAIDIVTCFNCISRRVGARLATELGFDPAFVDAWFGFYRDMRRAVVFQGSYSMPQGSRRGVPEGCPLSVVVMLIIGAAWACEAQHIAQGQPFTYYDNIEWIAKSTEDQEKLVKFTWDFMQMNHLQIDSKKSWVWRVQKKRDTNLHEHLGVQNATLQRDLGANMTYGRSPHLGCQKARLDESIIVLKKISSLRMSPTRKVLLYKQAVLTRAFYGHQVQLIGVKYFEAIRSQLKRIVVGTVQRANPFLGAVLAGDVFADPFLWATMDSLKTFRVFLRRHPEEQKRAFLALAAHPGTSRQAYGPVGVLARYLHSVGVQSTFEGLLTRSSGAQITLMNSSNADLEDFLTEQWEDNLLAKVRQRAYLQDAEAFSVKITFKLMREFTPQELALLRIHLAGGVTTGKVATNFVSSQDDGVCVHCGQPDRLQHRFRTCSATEAARKEHAFSAVLEQTTDAELISPWLPKPQSLDAWKAMLTVRWTLFHAILDGLQTREYKCAVWTDGSAVHQDAVYSIDSAFAVVSADTATGTQRNLFVRTRLYGGFQS